MPCSLRYPDSVVAEQKRFAAKMFNEISNLFVTHMGRSVLVINALVISEKEV